MLFTYLRITDYSFASLCIMYVWLNLLRRVLRLKWLHALMFPLLNTASRPLSTCFRSNYFDFVFPCIRFRFPDRALPFPYPFPHKNMKTKVVRVFSRSFPIAFIPSYVRDWEARPCRRSMASCSRPSTHPTLAHPPPIFDPTFFLGPPPFARGPALPCQ